MEPTVASWSPDYSKGEISAAWRALEVNPTPIQGLAEFKREVVEAE